MTSLPAVLRQVYVVVPGGIDEPNNRSGGNVYDRRVCDELRTAGWSVFERPVFGTWPHPDAISSAHLHSVVSAVPNGGLLLVDGLIASAGSDVLLPEARRLRLVVLVHMPFTGEADSVDLAAGEERTLSAAAAVITTSKWTRSRLMDRYPLHHSLVHVAEPGVDVAGAAPGTPAGGQLLCVAAVAPHKGHDVLLEALATLADLPWRCLCVGPLDRDPAYAARLGRHAHQHHLEDRFCLPGTMTGTDLDTVYATADVLVLPSRAETYGMVVTEALARALPVIGTDVGGLPEALGYDRDGHRPGVLVPSGDPAALAAAIGSWLGDTDLRGRLRQAAFARRATLTPWSATGDRISQVLTGVASC